MVWGRGFSTLASCFCLLPFAFVNLHFPSRFFGFATTQSSDTEPLAGLLAYRVAVVGRD